MPKPRKQRTPGSRFFVLDGDAFYISERDDEQLVAVRLTGVDRELPVLQGWTPGEYEDHAAMYVRRGYGRGAASEVVVHVQRDVTQRVIVRAR